MTDTFLRDTPYATEIATAAVGEVRIERIHVKAEGQDEIRFSWWPDGKMANRPLDIPEHTLLSLFDQAMQQRIFTQRFLEDLHILLARRARFANVGR